jgi:hypothetical protein
VKSRLAAGGALVVAVLALASSVAAQGEEVTMTMRRYFDPMCNCIRVQFTGRVSSGRADEYVTVLQQRCGSRFSTAMAGATTSAGGFWEAAPSSYYLHAPLVPGTFRARWKSHLSRPAVFRPPLRITVRRQRTGRFLVIVWPAHTTLRGEFLELQRLAGGQWKRVKFLRLGSGGKVNYGGSYWATFGVRTREWTMRVLASDETAAPCYASGATQTFRS